MAIVSLARGTQATVLTTVHVLSTQTGLGVYVLVVDTVDMTAGDVVNIDIQNKCLTGGTSRKSYSLVYSGVQTEPIKYSVPIPVDIEILCTICQTSGVARSYPWSLLRV